MRRKAINALATPQSAAAAEVKDAIEKNQIGKGEEPAVPPQPNAQTLPPAKPKKEKKRAKPQRIETILVRHDFTVQEMADLGRSLADKQRVAEDIEGEAKACARQYKDKLATVKQEIASATDKIKEGFEMISVEAIAMARVDKVKRTVCKAYYRKDTGQFIRAEDNVLNVELELFNMLPDTHDLKKPLPKKLLSAQV